MKLSKRVSARTKTMTCLWCRGDFCKYTEDFRRIRSELRNRMDKCFWCRHPFEDNEMMALAATENGNRVLCQACAVKLLASGNKGRCSHE